MSFLKFATVTYNQEELQSSFMFKKLLIAGLFAGVGLGVVALGLPVLLAYVFFAVSILITAQELVRVAFWMAVFLGAVFVFINFGGVEIVKQIISNNF